MATGFHFDAETHTYTEAGLVLPSVTQVLKDNGYIRFDRVPLHLLERKRKLGKLVHQLTEAYDKGEALANFDVPNEVMEYAQGWVNFRKDSSFVPIGVEHCMAGETHGMRYGMTLDVDGVFGQEYCIIEKKCGASESPVWGLQLAAYDWGRNGRTTSKRYALQMGPQFPRGYKLFPYEVASDYHMWGAALAQTIWKMNHGISTLENIPEREVA